MAEKRTNSGVTLSGCRMQVLDFVLEAGESRIGVICQLRVQSAEAEVSDRVLDFG
jgi:hypothetical protein